MDETPINVLFLEPFYGGSHKAFADGLRLHSGHRVTLLHMPARFWKWRMRGAALHFFQAVKNSGQYQLIIMSGLMSASDFKAMAGAACPPVLVYFHENQFSYPLSAGERMDYQFGFTDITTALAADRILFNSRTHMHMFFKFMGQFLHKMPDFRPNWAVDAIREKAFVCHPGCDITPPAQSTPLQTEPPLVIWNHRWEHDKDPESFFRAMAEVYSREINFRLAVLGETFEKHPPVFSTAKKQFNRQLSAFGYEPDRELYLQWLRQGSVAVSTAKQENFGISIVEAAACGCLPLVPGRLSYPEIIPEAFHETCIYASHEQLVEKLSQRLSNPGAFDRQRKMLAADMVSRYSWEHRIDEFDRHIRDTAFIKEKGRPR